jgi:hypothetical protein
MNEQLPFHAFELSLAGLLKPTQVIVELVTCSLLTRSDAELDQNMGDCACGTDDQPSFIPDVLDVELRLPARRA